LVKTKEMKNNEKYFRDIGWEDGRQMEMALDDLVFKVSSLGFC
jgi:hypothetical protein